MWDGVLSTSKVDHGNTVKHSVYSLGDCAIIIKIGNGGLHMSFA